MTVKSEPTVIYRSNPQKTRIDFPSCIRVIEENTDDIDPQIYIGYHKEMLRLAIGQNADEEIIAHYRKEATFLKEYLSFVQFLQMHLPKSKEHLELLRKEYVDHIAKIEVEL